MSPPVALRERLFVSIVIRALWKPFFLPRLQASFRYIKRNGVFSSTHHFQELEPNQTKQGSNI